MASESALRKLFAERVQGFDPCAQVRQVENAAGSGDPDTYVCTEGRSVWVELKYIPLPKRTSTPIRCRHIRTGQLLWAANHLKAGGRVWFLVQVGRWYLLLTAKVAAKLRHGLPREALYDHATVVYDGLPADVMQDMLTLPCDG